jgi:RsmE family RNA methyltransferase
MKRLDVAFPPENSNRFVCHPADPGQGDAIPPKFDLSKETVIALGPEGGWIEDEILALRNRGFIPVTCSSRIFTTDVALIALTSAISTRLNPALLGGHI